MLINLGRTDEYRENFKEQIFFLILKSTKWKLDSKNTITELQNTLYRFHHRLD